MIRALAISFTLLGAAQAQEVPLASPGDPRIRYVTYRVDRSVIIKVRRGVVTRLVLGRDEAITFKGAGFLSRCEVESDEWCIRAEAGESQVWVKPRAGATHNNLELATNKRDYSIKFEVLPDAPNGEAAPDEVFRAIFVYPAEPGPVLAPGQDAADGSARPAGSPALNATPVIRAAGNLAPYGCTAPRRLVNTQYTRDETTPAHAPSRVFDDGVHTVFVFGDAAPIPAVFAVAADGEESRVNFSVDGNCLVVHQLGRQFVLRSGKAALNVYNEAFEPGATSPPLRALRGSREVEP